GASLSGKVVTLSATGAAEVSGTLADQGHGLFTYYLLKGLDGAAAGADGLVTAESLFDYLSPKVRDEAGRDNYVQTPQLEPAGSRLVLLERPIPAAADAAGADGGGRL
ncbi:MAG TPA: hypothetical protein VH309_01300, partial [Elusimicrobiota bacterium]|nr:hypothetical protein [Elusimicrobiota bacterium]